MVPKMKMTVQMGHGCTEHCFGAQQTMKSYKAYTCAVPLPLSVQPPDTQAWFQKNFYFTFEATDTTQITTNFIFSGNGKKIKNKIVAS